MRLVKTVTTYTVFNKVLTKFKQFNPTKKTIDIF